MRNLVLSCALLVVAGCAKKEVPAGALKVEIAANGFAPGCVQVTADDAAGQHASSTLTNVARGSNQVLALEGPWGAGLKVTAQAFEQTCGTRLVATQTLPATVPATGVGSLSLALTAPDDDRDGFVASSAGGSDCNDSSNGGSSIHPGATELCNGIDDNCDGRIDEGLNSKTYYQDQDNDGYGQPSGSRVACSPPGANWVLTAGDCNDSPDGGAAVHPGATELCNGMDDDCNGTIDDGFGVGDPCLSNNCDGTLACDPSGTATVCSTPNYYPDLDGDGHGDLSSQPLTVCPLTGGVATSNDDCDDQDPSTYPGAPDVCDQRDNSCSGSTNVDPSCPKAQWASVTVSAADAGWTTASAYGVGQVWFAGNSNALSLHTDAGFSDQSAQCATASGNWHASWAGPSGTVYLGGEDGLVANQGLVVSVGPSGNCQALTGITAPSGVVLGLTGIAGSGSPDVYAVTRDGKVYRSDGTNATLQNNQPLLGIHGTMQTALLAVGSTGGGSPSPTAWQRRSNGNWAKLTLPGGLNGTLRAVYVLDASHAYLVGDDMVLFFNPTLGSFQKVSLPSDATATTSFNSVIAFNPSTVYVVDSDQKVRRYDGKGGWQTLAGPLGSPLNAITGVSPADLWVAGDNDLTVHWHEP